MDKKTSRREMAGKGVMGLFVGLSLMAAGIVAGRQLHIVWSIWPSVDGEVVRGTVQEILQVPSTKGGMLAHAYAPMVEFRYVVGGTSFTATAPSVYTSDSYGKAVANLTGLYAPGTHHPIRYNPREPHDIRFGVIKFGPLMFSFLLLFGGVALSAGGLNSLVMAYPQHEEREAPKIPVTVLPSSSGTPREPATTILLCPACGRRVEADETTCPNCRKSLRAA
jgi:hypothetical protein